MKVFYVTAEHGHSPHRQTVDGPMRVRTDLAKFFTFKDAERHCESLHLSWRERAVEERDEPSVLQHPAHGAVGN